MRSNSPVFGRILNALSPPCLFPQGPGGRKVLAQLLEFESLKTNKVYTSTAPTLYTVPHTPR